MLGVYVSLLNHCQYCTAHHFEGLKVLLDDDEQAAAIWNALKSGEVEGVFNGKEIALLRYSEKLTLRPGSMEESDVLALKEQGLSEGEVLEINQVVSYFAYANRTVQGLGVSTEGDILGLSPGDGDDPGDWHHDKTRT